MSERAITIPKRNKALRNNMLQGRRVCINLGFDDELILKEDDSSVYKLLDIPALITSSDMHLTFSNCFDQYKVVSYTLTIHLKGIRFVGFDLDEEYAEYGVIFTVFDRTKIKDGASWTTLKTYQSYVETQFPVTGDNMKSANRTIRSNSQYTDTKSMTSVPYMYYGIGFSSGTWPGDVYFSVSVNIKVDVYYRGVRYDESWVSTRLNPMIKRSTPSTAVIQQVTTFRDYIYINKLRFGTANEVRKVIDLDNPDQDDPFVYYPNGVGIFTYTHNGVYVLIRKPDGYNFLNIWFSYQVAGTVVDLGTGDPVWFFNGDADGFNGCQRLDLCYNDIPQITIFDSSPNSGGYGQSFGRFDLGFVRF